MTTELAELAARALSAPSLSSAGLGEVIKSVIDCTRRHWAAISGEPLALDAACASVSAACTEPRQPMKR